MFLVPFISLPEIESKIAKFNGEINGKADTFYWWGKFKADSIPLIVKSKKPIKISAKNSKEYNDEVYIGILNPNVGRVFYRINYDEEEKDSMAVFTLYGVIKKEGNNINTRYFSPAVEKFLLIKPFMEIVNLAVEKNDHYLAISKFLINLYEKIQSFKYEEFVNFCKENNLKHILTFKENSEFFIPINFVNKENYKNFHVFFYLSLLFWLIFGNIEIRIIE